MSSDVRAVPRHATIAPAAIIEFLAGTELLRNVERATIERIAPHVFPAEVPARTVIARAGAKNPAGRSASRLAILPGTSHYDIAASPALAAAVESFLAAP